MLVITRKEGQKIMIGDDITVIIKHVRGRQVSVGIDAPREIEVHREEVKERIEAEGRKE